LGGHLAIVPYLQQHSSEQRPPCLLITFADDAYIGKREVLELVTNYIDNDHDCIVSNRLMRIGFCSTNPWMISQYSDLHWPIVNKILTKEFMTLTSISDGALFHTSHFSLKYMLDEQFLNLTRDFPDVGYRFATLFNNVSMATTASLGRGKYSKQEKTYIDVYIEAVKTMFPHGYSPIYDRDASMLSLIPSSAYYQDMVDPNQTHPISILRASHYIHTLDTSFKLLEYIEPIVMKERGRCFSRYRNDPVSQIQCGIKACSTAGADVIMNKRYLGKLNKK
jgi:hypothetical protein